MPCISKSELDESNYNNRRVRESTIDKEHERIKRICDEEIARYGPDSYCRAALRLLRDRILPPERG